MTTLVYTGGEIVGYEIKVGEKFRLMGQYEALSGGVLVKFFELKGMERKITIYMTPREYVETMELIN